MKLLIGGASFGKTYWSPVKKKASRRMMMMMMMQKSLVRHIGLLLRRSKTKMIVKKKLGRRECWVGHSGE